ncbi:MAG: sulfite exporter TauE/SafE family protein [Desulfobacteraceae bacterium]|nr:sulfite exporter TauE/SafE family protein [Desulfobacteraceae bacterium]
MFFPASGVETYIFIPPLVAFTVSFFTSMGGVSGAFLLLPFQMSVLHYTAPSVSGTNQLFNIVAIPSGVWRFIKEKRMVWPLTWAVIIGTLPGVLIGAWVRIKFLPDPKNFKFFVGFVLFYIGLKLLNDTFKTKVKTSDNKSQFIVTNALFSLRRIEFNFGNKKFSFSTLAVFFLCFIVGIIGGIYGIGGGSIIAPFFITFFHLPVYVIAGAALMGTFVTSLAGVIFYQTLALFYPDISVAPDWYLGILFGIGGFFGMYLGARCQKYVPAHIIKAILCCCVLFVAGKYIFDFFM